MPDWTCAKCGIRIEGFSWEDKPWNAHVCSDIRKDLEHLETGDITPPNERKNNLTDFF